MTSRVASCLIVVPRMCRRFRDPNPDEIEALTLEGMRELVMSQLHAGNIEINLVGDIDPKEVDDVVLRYLGTVAPRDPAPQPLPVRPPMLCSPPAHIRHQAWHLKVCTLPFCIISPTDKTCDQDRLVSGANLSQQRIGSTPFLHFKSWLCQTHDTWMLSMLTWGCVIQ